MAIRKYMERIQDIDELVHKHVTGTVEELAQRIHLSRSALEKEMRDLRKLGVPVIYDKRHRRLRYKESGRMIDHLFERIPRNRSGEPASVEEERLSGEGLKKIMGGSRARTLLGPDTLTPPLTGKPAF